jgi:CPA2 family monovalent cation:H+ antiporter-2
VQSTVEPFKGLLLGMFFFTVGMNIDLRELVREPLWLAACVAALILGKSLVSTALGRLYRLSWSTSIETGLLLAAGGEFAFVGVGAAGALGLVAHTVSQFVLAVTSITMALTPLLAMLARRLTKLSAVAKAVDPALALRPASGTHAIVVGHGRVGKVVCALLKQHGLAFVATDSDALAVTRDRRDGLEVFYGDATDRDYLMVCGLMQATAVIITINGVDAIDEIVALVRSLRADIPIIARARDARHAAHLYAEGATDVVPETIEASLQLSEAALVGLGVAMGPAIASIHEKRDAFRHALQEAARAAGIESSHAVKRKTLRRSP